MLGAQFVISGSIIKTGKTTYTVKADLFTVASARTERTKGSNYNGPIEGMLTTMEVLAWEIMGAGCTTITQGTPIGNQYK